MDDNIDAGKPPWDSFLSSLSFRMSLITAAVFAAVLLGVVWIVYKTAHNEALREAEGKAMIILNRNLATHSYFNKTMKPQLFSWTEPLRQPNYFDPVWMSSTYAIRELNRIANETAGQDRYYYKECAINARTPENEADEFERQFLLELNKDPRLKKKSGIRAIEGKPYFYVLHRGETMEEVCMRCHSLPKKAPGDMVLSYGTERSFFRSAGDVVSAVSIRIPLDQAYTEADKLVLRLSLIVVAVFVSLFLFLGLLIRHSVFAPLAFMKLKARDIIASAQHLGEEVPVPSGTELKELAVVFNTMSHKLRENVDRLEDRVKERTVELEKAGEALHRANRLLEQQATTDSLTGIYNRLKFDDMLIKEIGRATRHHFPLSLIMFDIDNFKAINDSHGHHVGDKVLRQLTARIGTKLRKHDYFARWGGEEFMILLTHNTIETAALFAEHLRAEIEAFRIPDLQGVTCSFGVTQLNDDDDIFSLTKRADDALYKAKSSGKNRVAIT